MHKDLFSKSNFTQLLPFILLLPALLIHLGSMPLLADEPTRALVALEMLISKNFIVPTINGQYYYNKPPLYNWMLAGLFQITGQASEWIVRIPTVLSILLFSSIVYYFTKKNIDKKIAVVVVLAYLTCGRVLFYDSFMGLIDTLFSALVFLNFMWVYHFGEKKKYHYLFILTYLITAVLYMLKGLPGLVFQGITFFIYFVFFKKQWKHLFSAFHFIGIFIMIGLVSIYYFQYLKYNDLETVFKTILSESTKRTIAEKSVLDSIVHIFIFPFETILNFLPWTVPFLLLLKKENFKKIQSNSFLKFIFFLFIGNIGIYWLSPETVPRYLFMFLPLIFIIAYFLYFEENNYKFKFIFEKALLVIGVLLVLAFISFPFIKIIPNVPFYYLKLIFTIGSLILLLFYFYENESQKLILFCSILLIARIGFDWFIFPSRLQTEPEISFRYSGIRVGKTTKGQKLYIYKWAPVNHDISFYISRERNEILSPTFKKVEPNTFYITDIFDKKLQKQNLDIIYEFYTSYNNTKLYLVKTKNQNEN